MSIFPSKIKTNYISNVTDQIIRHLYKFLEFFLFQI